MAKTKYDPEQLILVEGWARHGLTDEQIAHNLGISKDTFYKWKKRFPDFADALKRNKEVADLEVENATFRAAKGFTYEEDVVTHKGTVVRVQRYQPPNPTLNIFWLKNRMPQEWRDKIDHEHSTPKDQPLEVRHDTSDRVAGYLDTLAEILRHTPVDDAPAHDPGQSVDSGRPDPETGPVPPPSG